MSSRLKFFIGLMAFTIVVRLLPALLTPYDIKIDPSVIFYPWNFVSLTSICLYAGAYFTDRRMSFGLPLLTVFLSDLGIGLLKGHPEWASPGTRWPEYLCYAIVIIMGAGLDRRTWPSRALHAVARGIVAEMIFFLLSNFAYFQSQTDLPHDIAGLTRCYIQGIPFAAKGFASTAFYSVLLFSPLAIRAAGGTATVAPIKDASAVPVSE